MAFCVEQNINKTYICYACRKQYKWPTNVLLCLHLAILSCNFLSTLPNCWSREDFIIFLPRQQNWREFQFAKGFILPAFHAPRIWRNGIARDSAVGTAQAFQFKLAFFEFVQTSRNTTFQWMMNASPSPQRFWAYHLNGFSAFTGE